MLDFRTTRPAECSAGLTKLLEALLLESELRPQRVGDQEEEGGNQELASTVQKKVTGARIVQTRIKTRIRDQEEVEEQVSTVATR